jgi:hypothetical protein
MEKIVLRLREIAIEFPDGSVFGIARLEYITSGWVVRMIDAGDFEGENGMYEAMTIASRTTGKISRSKDGDLELWDVVEVFEDEFEATEAGYDNEQMTIYQIETGRLKWLD